MSQPARPRTDPDEMRARILAVAEEHFRKIGYQKTSVADIASELGMSPANIYRFFPNKAAINESICGRILQEVIDLAFKVARSRAAPPAKMAQLFSEIHKHNRETLIREKRTHDMVAAAMEENWDSIQLHLERLTTIFEGIIREGLETGDFDVPDPFEAAYSVKLSFLPFFHPLLIEHCIRHGVDTDEHLRLQTRYILRALGYRG